MNTDQWACVEMLVRSGQCGQEPREFKPDPEKRRKNSEVWGSFSRPHC